MKRTIYMLIMLILFTINCNLVFADEFDITSNEAILYNLNDNKIIYELNKDSKVPVASLTKIMTAVVALENIDNLEEKITLTKDVFEGLEGYSKAGFQIGDVVTYEDLLYGIILPSGADAVNAIVLNTVGDLGNFVDKMNQKAKELNLTNTHFDNAIGMDSNPEEVDESNTENVNLDDYGNYSTAQDIATLLKYALSNDTFKKIFTTKKYTTSSNLVLKSSLTNYASYSNLDVSNILGAKSGFTDEAGLCLASISTINDVDYLLVTLGASTNNKSNAIKDSITIYDYYSNNYSYKEVINKNQVIETIPIKWGRVKKYDIISPNTIKLYLKNDIDLTNIKYEYNGIDELNYKINKNDKLGTVQITYNDEVLTSFDVFLNEDLKYYHPIIYIITLFILIILLCILKFKKKKKRRFRKRRKRK